MQFIIIVTILALTNRLVTLTTAKPMPNRKASSMTIPLTRHSAFLDSNKSIDLDAIASHAILVREKILTGLDNYEMNTGVMHPYAVKRSDSKSRLGKRGASVPLTTFQNKIWMSEISIGTPPKTLKVNIDTGSADLWVLETGCSGISADRDLWDPHLSESAETESQTFQLKYLDGSIVEGNLYTDNVTIGGFTADPQTFGSATSYTTLRSTELPADGLLGLAFPSVSQFGPDSLLKSLVGQNRLLNPTFSFKLSSTGGEMYIGGANSMLYNGDITYTPVRNPGFWQVSMDSVHVNGVPIFENIPAVFDTGTEFILGDWERVSELYKRLGGTRVEHRGLGFYYLRCDSFPTVSFAFGGRAFGIPGETLRLQPIRTGSSYCFSAIMAQRSYAFWDIGLVFLRGVYSVFDYSASQVGFADLN